MGISELKELGSEELKLKLDSLTAPDLFKDILELARFHAGNAQFTNSNLCCHWLISSRTDFAPAYIQLCSNYLSEKKYDRIVELLSDSMSRIQGDENQKTLLMYMYAKALLELNLLDKARDVLNETKEWESKPLWYNLVEIDVLFKSGELDKVLTLLDDKIDYYGDNSVFVKKKFEILNKAGQSQEAYRQILASLERDENNLELLHQKAMINYERQEFLEAKLSYTKILKLSKDYKAHLWMGRIFKIENDEELATYHLNEAFKSALSDSDKLHCLNILAELSDDKLIDQLQEKWFGKSNRNPETLLELSRVRSKQLKHKEAEELLKDAIQIAEDPRLYFELAKVYSSLKEYDKAESILVLENLMYKKPIDFFARYEYCLIPKRRGRFIDSLQRFKEFSLMNSQNFDIKSEIVNLYLKLSEFTLAYEYLKEEIKNSPENQKAWNALIDCYYQNQNYFEGLSLLDEYEEKFGSNEKFIYYKSACLREVGRYEESEKVLIQGLQHFPDSFDLRMSYAHLYRRLSSEYFFEKDAYHTKALEMHRSAKPAYAYQQRVMDMEIIKDLMHLNRYGEALEEIERLLDEKPDHIELVHQKVRVLSNMGNHRKAIDLIFAQNDSVRSDVQMKILESNELLALDKWEKCSNLLDEILSEEMIPDALIIKIKLLLRMGELNDAKESFKSLFDVSPHHAFIHNDLIDFALTQQDMYLNFYQKLDIDNVHGSESVIKLHADRIVQDGEYELIIFKNNVSISHIVIDNCPELLDDLCISNNGVDFSSLKPIPTKLSLKDDQTVVNGVFDLLVLKVPAGKAGYVSIHTIYPLHTEGSVEREHHQSRKGMLFSMNIVETGLGDQLHYMRTSALLAESLGMKFAGFLRSQLEIIRDRVTTDERLYKDLGWAEFQIEDEDYQIIELHLNLKTRFIPALYQWNSYYQFLEYIDTLLEEALAKTSIDENKTQLVYFSVDDHNFTRLIAKLFYPYHEPQTAFIQKLRSSFLKKRDVRIGSSALSGKQILLQCRLGDVANIPMNYKGEDVWVIPFSGEVMKDNVSNKYHMRYSNLEKIRDIGIALKEEFGDSVELKLITDGYDYGVDYLKEFQENLMREMGMDHEQLEALKARLYKEFKETFEFVDEIVYGEEYDKLIRSIDLVTSSNVLISTNGQFTNEFKMSFASSEEDYLIVKKLYSNLRVSRSINSTELFWETDGYDSETLVAKICDYIRRFS